MPLVRALSSQCIDRIESLRRGDPFDRGAEEGLRSVADLRPPTCERRALSTKWRLAALNLAPDSLL